MNEYINKIINDDCLNILKNLPNDSVDLVLTDPPYGINYGGQLIKGDEYTTNTNEHGWRNFGTNEWDTQRPSQEIFNEILRVSKNQIIWGGNYFADMLPASQGWLVWNKCQRNFSLADGELAWTSFDCALRIFDYSRGQHLKEGDRFHATQKPLELFAWCLRNKTKENDIILDPFSGSATTAIVCHRLKRRFICIEKDKDYYEKSVERLKKEKIKRRLF